MTFTINRQISTSSAQPLTTERTKTALSKGKKGTKSPSIFKLLKKSIGRLIKKGSSSAKQGKKSSKKFQQMQQQSAQLLKHKRVKQASQASGLGRLDANNQVRQSSRASGLGRLDAKVQSSGDEQDVHDLEMQQQKLIASKIAQSAQSLALSRGQPQQQAPARRQAAAEQIPATKTVVAKFIVKNVNQMKSQPLTLGEKLSRWCQQSSAAIFKGCAPEDHFLPFPSADYCDNQVDRRAEAELLSAIAGSNQAVEAEARDEVVLERYPTGRHGLSPRTRPTGTPEAAAAASKAVATLLQEIKGRRSHARLHHLQAKLKKRPNKKAPSQPELKALRWMKDQQTQQRRAASGTSTISMAAGVGSARNLSDCLGSTLDLGRMQDGTLARVAE